jgi:hypothetical protein
MIIEMKYPGVAPYLRGTIVLNKELIKIGRRAKVRRRMEHTVFSR